jgi:UDP-N-acetylglucosamine:LPS N-acetylglucosamine transferase
VNADYLAGHGAAVVIEDAKMEAELYQGISSLISDTGRMQKMQSAMRALAVKDAAGKIARIVLETAEKRTRD